VLWSWWSCFRLGSFFGFLLKSIFSFLSYLLIISILVTLSVLSVLSLMFIACILSLLPILSIMSNYLVYLIYYMCDWSDMFFFPIFNPFVAWYLSPFAIYFPHLSCYLFIVLLILQPHLTTKNNIRTELRGLVSFICGRRCTLLSIPPLPQNKVCTWCVHILEYMQDRCMCEGSMCFNIFQSPEGPWATVCNPVRPLFDPE
jgi:hypothetical protein